MRGKKERKIESLKWNVIEGRLMVWRHNWAPLKRLSKRYWRDKAHCEVQVPRLIPTVSNPIILHCIVTWNLLWFLTSVLNRPFHSQPINSDSFKWVTIKISVNSYHHCWFLHFAYFHDAISSYQIYLAQINVIIDISSVILFPLVKWKWFIHITSSFHSV